MSPMEYRRREEPGCGGCLFFFVILILLSGGAPLLFRVIGVLMYSGLFVFLAVAAAFWGVSFYIKRKISTYEKSQTEVHNTFVTLLIHILVRIAQADGKITREEVATIRRFFQLHLRYTQSQLLWVKDLIKEATASTASLESLLEEFRRQFAYESRLLLVDLTYQMLYSNSAVRESDLEMVRNIARYLEISPLDLRAIEARFTGGYRPAAAPYGDAEKERRSFKVLGLEPGAGFDQIKASYRRLSMKHHPDKVRHLGEEFREAAEEKMKDLNEAYERLERKYGQ